MHPIHAQDTGSRDADVYSASLLLNVHPSSSFLWVCRACGIANDADTDSCDKCGEKRTVKHKKGAEKSFHSLSSDKQQELMGFVTETSSGWRDFNGFSTDVCLPSEEVSSRACPPPPSDPSHSPNMDPSYPSSLDTDPSLSSLSSLSSVLSLPSTGLHQPAPTIPEDGTPYNQHIHHHHHRQLKEYIGTLAASTAKETGKSTLTTQTADGRPKKVESKKGSSGAEKMSNKEDNLVHSFVPPLYQCEMALKAWRVLQEGRSVVAVAPYDHHASALAAVIIDAYLESRHDGTSMVFYVSSSPRLYELRRYLPHRQVHPIHPHSSPVVVGAVGAMLEGPLRWVTNHEGRVENVLLVIEECHLCLHDQQYQNLLTRVQERSGSAVLGLTSTAHANDTNWQALADKMDRALVCYPQVFFHEMRENTRPVMVDWYIIEGEDGESDQERRGQKQKEDKKVNGQPWCKLKLLLAELHNLAMTKEGERGKYEVNIFLGELLATYRTVGSAGVVRLLTTVMPVGGEDGGYSGDDGAGDDGDSGLDPGADRSLARFCRLAEECANKCDENAVAPRLQKVVELWRQKIMGTVITAPPPP